MNKKLNICLLNDSFPPLIDGVSNAVLNYAREIHGKLGNVVVATPSYPGYGDKYPFPVVRYPSISTERIVGYRTGVPFSPFTLRELSRYNIDIIHSHCPFASMSLARSLRMLTDAPIVFTYHTKFDIDIAHVFDASFMQSAAKKFMLSNVNACDEVWAVSGGAGENLKSLGYSGAWRVMENGVDFPRGRVSEAAVERLRTEHGLDESMPVFLYVGRMMWYKGIRRILDGLFRAKATGVKFRMIFVGSGNDFGDISHAAKTLGIGDECIFTGAVRDREKLRTYFSLADMFLFPSTYDTNGLVVREAACCGLASVLIRGSAAAEGVTDGRNGLFVDESPASMARAISFAAENRAKVRNMGFNAMNEIVVSWADAVSRAYDAYHEVLDKRRISVR